MATRKKKVDFGQMVEQIEEAAGKASVNVEDALRKAQEATEEAARELRQKGRDIDDQLDAWADENANDLSAYTGMSKDDSSMAIKVAVWLLVIGFVAFAIKAVAGFFG